MEIASEQGEFFLCGGVFGSRCIERGRGGVRFAAGCARRRFRVGGFFLFLFGLGGEVTGAEEREGEDEGREEDEPRALRYGKTCGVAMESLRPEGLSYRAAGERRAADGVTVICRRWRRDIRRGRWNRRRPEFPPSSDKSNPPGGP